MIISGQIFGSKLQRVFTLGDGCWLPISPNIMNLTRESLKEHFFPQRFRGCKLPQKIPKNNSRGAIIVIILCPRVVGHERDKLDPLNLQCIADFHRLSRADLCIRFEITAFGGAESRRHLFVPSSVHPRLQIQHS